MRGIARSGLVLAATLLLAACSSGTSDAPGDAEGWTRISPVELRDLMAREDAYLVNVHVPYEGEIPGTDAFIPYTELVDRAGELPSEGGPALVLYCRSGNMSTEAAEDLVASGRTGFYELEGGFVAWNETGLPFES